MNNNINDKPINKCTGCQFCSAVCPVGAIKIILDADGFYSPLIDMDKCINCGICKKYCYKYDNHISTTDSDSVCVYACQSKNKELLLSSSSGGVATHIAEECLKQGYKILGVKYDTELDIAVTCIANNEEAIRAFKGSKYIQSYTENAFKKVLEDKTKQKYAIFGTPCQIYSISKYIKQINQEDRFLLIDLFCHGCPSMNLWKKYVQSIKKEIKAEKFDKIEFRSKIYGWHEFCHYFIKGNIVYKSKRINEPFFTLYFDNNILCEACYDCKIRSSFEYTDIRLGDFWGSEYALNNEGVSVVVLASERGKIIFNEIEDKLWIKEHKLEDAIKSQSYGLVYHYNKDLRRKLLELLKTNNEIWYIFKEAKKLFTVKKHIKLLAKTIIYFLPKSIRYRLKKRMYKIVRK